MTQGAGKILECEQWINYNFGMLDNNKHFCSYVNADAERQNQPKGCLDAMNIDEKKKTYHYT